jgi:hypothetical protein
MAAQPAGEHLDADLLTAFAEQALSAPERERVSAHLATCAACREIVALAMPAEEPAPRVLVMPAAARTSWFSLPLVRWGIGIAAACIVLAAVVLYQPQPARGPSESDLVRMTAPSSPAPPATSDKSAEQANAPAALKAARPTEQERSDSRPPEPPAKKDESRGALFGAAQPTAPAPEARRHRPGVGGPSPQISQMPGQSQAYEQQRQQAAPPPPPRAPADAINEERANSTAVSSDAAGAVQAKTARKATDSIQAANQAGVAPSDRAMAKKAEAGGAIGGSVGAVPLQKQRALASAAARTFWSISPSGRLQRSNDGAHWENVGVDGDISFRAVTSIGADVWAGGSGGALYHSPDDGTTWRRVQVGTPPITETITRLAFSDARTGTLTTASGARWATTDAGRTWTEVH